MLNLCCCSVSIELVPRHSIGDSPRVQQYRCMWGGGWAWELRMGSAGGKAFASAVCRTYQVLGPVILYWRTETTMAVDK